MKLRYRVVCYRAGVRIEIDDLDRLTALQTEIVMQDLGYTADWYSYLVTEAAE